MTDQTTEPTGDPHIGVTEVAALLGTSVWQVRQWVRAGSVPHHKQGSRTLFHAAELDAWRRNGRQMPATLTPELVAEGIRQAFAGAVITITVNFPTETNAKRR